MDDDVSDQVRLQLPMSIGMRYGTVPDGMTGASVVPADRISISIDVRMQGAVKSIASPTHPTVILGPHDVPAAPATARYRSPDFLAQDFVLSVTAEGLNAPRCFAQRAPDGSVAMQLSVVPKFTLPPVPTQEYIFLVDRSGSMSGGRISTAKKALVMLLRALPSQGTHFNIMSFGDHCKRKWTESVEYNESTLVQAVGLSFLMLRRRILIILCLDQECGYYAGGLRRNRNQARAEDCFQLSQVRHSNRGLSPD